MKRAIIPILIVVMALPAGAAELLLPGQTKSSRGVFFPYSASLRLLAEVEQCRTELPALRELVSKDEDQIGLQERRIAELGKQAEDLKQMNKKALEAAEAARKGGSWMDRVLSAGKWIVAGALLGFVLGAGK